MLTPDEILELATSKAEEFRKWETNTKPDKGYPDFTPIYPETVKMAEHIAIHAENDTFPTSLFQKKRPNESDEQFDYIKANYKPVTRPYWNRALNPFGRAWNTQNYNIDWQPDKEKDIYKDDSAKKYFTEEYPGHKSILSYFESITTRHKANDPNAVICYKPYTIPTKNNEAGEVVLDDTIMIRPSAVIYGSEQVVGFVENSYCLILLHERSELKTGNNRYEKKGLIFEYYDLNTIWRIIQVGKESENTFVGEIYYQHNLNELPCERLKGIPIQKESETYYKSPLFDALPNLDLALVHAQTLDASIIANAFKQYWEYADKCAGENGLECIDGYVGYDTDRHKCGTCHGTGKVNKRSVLGAIQIIPGNRLNDNDENVNIPPAGYIEEDTTILDFLDKYVERKCIQAFAMLNIDVSDSVVKGSETALKSKIDREELFAMILTFSNELFALLKNAIRICGLMRYGNDFNMPEIQPPVDFAIRSEYDLTEELAKAKESGVPVAAFRYIVKQYIRQRCNSETLIRREDLRFSVDSLATKDDLTIIAGVGAGLIPKWKAILHDEFDIYLDQILTEDTEFLLKPLAEQTKKLTGMAQAEAKTMQPAANDPEGIIAKMAS